MSDLYKQFRAAQNEKDMSSLVKDWTPEDIREVLTAAVIDSGMADSFMPETPEIRPEPKPDLKVYVIQGCQMFFKTHEEAQRVLEVMNSTQRYISNRGSDVNDYRIPEDAGYFVSDTKPLVVDELMIYSEEGLAAWQARDKEAREIWSEYYAAKRKYQDDQASIVRYIQNLMGIIIEGKSDFTGVESYSERSDIVDRVGMSLYPRVFWKLINYFSFRFRCSSDNEGWEKVKFGLLNNYRKGLKR